MKFKIKNVVIDTENLSEEIKKIYDGDNEKLNGKTLQILALKLKDFDERFSKNEEVPKSEIDDVLEHYMYVSNVFAGAATLHVPVISKQADEARKQINILIGYINDDLRDKKKLLKNGNYVKL